MIVGLIKQDAGKITIGDHDISQTQCMAGQSRSRLLILRKLQYSENLASLILNGNS